MTRLGEQRSAFKRFYKTATLKDEGGAFSVLLDGRSARTPKKALLATPHRALADAIVKEWNAAEDVIDTTRMPQTRLLTTVIDLADEERPSWRDIILDYLKSDLTCYRALSPAALVEKQASTWDPLLALWRDRFGVALSTTSGVMAVEQPRQAIDATASYLEKLAHEPLLAARTATEIAGSAVIALLATEAPDDRETLFEASRLDERFQEDRWGVDAGAKEREQAMKADFFAAIEFSRLSSDDA
ncbi:MAG: ATP12 family protein [Pseudomonadota bacterium]